jgi:hypothetical protein
MTQSLLHDQKRTLCFFFVFFFFTFMNRIYIYILIILWLFQYMERISMCRFIIMSFENVDKQVMHMKYKFSSLSLDFFLFV